MHSWFLAALMVLLLAAPAGAVITEQEPANDAVATAPFVIVKFGSVTTSGGELGLTAGDIDFLGIPALAVGDIVTMSTTPLDNSNFEDPDTIMGLFDSAIAPSTLILCRNDDAPNNGGEFAPGLGSLCRFQITAPGNYYVGVTGFDDAGVPFDGNHTENGDYVVSITIISGPTPTPTPTPTATPSPTPTPEPGLMLQLASGGLGLAWLHRRRTQRKGTTA
jgi:hypothetical protein